MGQHYRSNGRRDESRNRALGAKPASGGATTHSGPLAECLVWAFAWAREQWPEEAFARRSSGQYGLLLSRTSHFGNQFRERFPLFDIRAGSCLKHGASHPFGIVHGEADDAHGRA